MDSEFEDFDQDFEDLDEELSQFDEQFDDVEGYLDSFEVNMSEVEFPAVNMMKIRRFIRTEKAPVAVFFKTFHK